MDVPSRAAMTLKLEGAFTALVTPFRDDKVDHASLAALVEFQIADGISSNDPFDHRAFYRSELDRLAAAGF